MSTLVIGGTGTVGSHVVGELLRRGEKVKVLTRSPEKASRLPSGTEGIVGDLRSPDTARTAFTGIERVFLLTALGQTETHEGLLAVNGARMAGVKRLVAMTVLDPEHAPHLPHFGLEAGHRGRREGVGDGVDDPAAEQLPAERPLVQGRDARRRRVPAALRRSGTVTDRRARHRRGGRRGADG